MKTCEICGQEKENWRIPEDICFTCQHWMEILADHTPKNEHKWCVANGTHYWVGDEDAKGQRGFDGAHVRIHFFDGTVIDTTNLWCQGDIDPHWLPKFPNNATLEWCRN